VLLTTVINKKAFKHCKQQPFYYYFSGTGTTICHVSVCCPLCLS